MTSKPDWAEKIAAKIEVGIEGKEPEQFIEEMSKALRRAKADGMRECSKAIFDLDGALKVNPKFGCGYLLEMADEIEHGES